MAYIVHVPEAFIGISRHTTAKMYKIVQIEIWDFSKICRMNKWRTNYYIT